MSTTLTAVPTLTPTPAAPQTRLQIAVIDSTHAGSAAHRLPIDEEFTGALPPSKCVLAVGCSRASLGARYERTYPGSTWRELDHIDELFGADAQPLHDLIVIGDDLPSNRHPLALFDAITRWAAPGANLVLQFDQGATLATLERVMEGDFSDDGDAPAVGRHSVSSIYKHLMDAGWMPTLAGHRLAPSASQGIASAALAMADMLNIPRGSAMRTLALSQVVVRARRLFEEAPPAPSAALFAAVVPTTRDRQLRLNVEASPGLREVAARIVTCRNAQHPGEALEASLAACDTDWVLLCHQDVYFPRGFGARLNAVLAAIPADEHERTLIGFVGMGVNTETQGYEPAGFVIDRLEAADHPASDHAVSMDELAIVVARRSLHRIDPALGWHLWATDLCITSICEHSTFARIVRLPLFHNSVTDFALPEGFHTSAAVLARKHAAFGPIATLCTTIDEAFVKTRVPRPPGLATLAPDTAAAPPAHAGAALDLVLQPDTQEAAARIAAGDFEGATAALYSGVHRSYTQPEVKHRKLYYPAFDQQLVQLATALGREPGEARSGTPGVPLIIATELYDLGGHSRVLEEISREIKQPVLVLTDLFRTYHRDPAQLERLRQRFSHVQLIVLPDVPLWEKCRMLRTLDLRLKPRSTLYFGHHQDPIPFIGTLSQPGRKRLFFHHGDHNPSLGCTLPGVEHVDLIANLQELCAERLGHAVHRLPLYIADQGRKTFPVRKGLDYSVVTSGHPAKFSRGGAVALQEIVTAALQTVQGRFFHIGPLDDAWIAEIRAHLAARQIDPARFEPLGLVPSVWGTLKSIDAAVYIGSAPVSGGRAGIEAQGCGYPVLCFKGFDAGSLLADYSSYADAAMGWADVDELRALLATVGDRHTQLSQAARAFYEAEFSHTRFRKLLRGLLGQ